MPLYRDAAIVLRTQKLGEADRIITLLARDRGLVRAVAKGVRKTKSRFGATLEPGLVVDVQLYEGRSLDTVREVRVYATYGEQIAADYAAWTSGAAMLETAERLVGEKESSRQQFALLAGALSALAEGVHDPGLVLDAYLLRAMAVAGWAASFEDCARCGAPGPHKAFNIASGGCLCPSCRTPGSAAPALATLELLGALLEGDWASADASEPRHRREGSGLVAAFVQWHLERGVRSLRLVERS